MCARKEPIRWEPLCWEPLCPLLGTNLLGSHVGSPTLGLGFLPSGPKAYGPHLAAREVGAAAEQLAGGGEHVDGERRLFREGPPFWF